MDESKTPRHEVRERHDPKWVGGVLDSSIVQGPFSVAPCQTLISRFATLSWLCAQVSCGALSCGVTGAPLLVFQIARLSFTASPGEPHVEVECALLACSLDEHTLLACRRLELRVQPHPLPRHATDLNCGCNKWRAVCCWGGEFDAIRTIRVRLGFD